MINGHGNNLYHYDKDKIKGDFSSNIAFNNHSDKILSFLKDRIEVVKNYPDPEATKLTKKIALHHNIQSENILVTNGSAEAFYVVAHYISRKANNRSRTLIFTPAFAEYEDSCALFEHQLSFTSTDNFHSEDFSAYDSVWIGSPNNPNGYRVTNEEEIGRAHV